MSRRAIMQGRYSHQQGAVLAVSLALLLVLTLLALAASQATRNQSEFAANVRERDVAFQAAEAALRAGERMLASREATQCAEQRCRVYRERQLGETLPVQSTEWWRQHAWAYTTGEEWVPWSEALAGERSAQDAGAFVIEEFGYAPYSLTLSRDGPYAGTAVFRITAAAPARSGRPLVVLQSTFSVAVHPEPTAASECRDASLDGAAQGLAPPESSTVMARLRNGALAALVSEDSALLVVDAGSGRVLARLDVRGASADARLSTPAAVDVDADQIIDAVYAGDVHGDLWRFDLSSAEPGEWRAADEPLFRARDREGRAQPITGRPEVARGPAGNDAVVLLAAGPDTLYAVIDRDPRGEDGPVSASWRLELPPTEAAAGDPFIRGEYVMFPIAAAGQRCSPSERLRTIAVRIRDGALQQPGATAAFDAPLGRQSWLQIR